MSATDLLRAAILYAEHECPLRPGEDYVEHAAWLIRVLADRAQELQLKVKSLLEERGKQTSNG